jgi:hypothetical protein
MKRMISTAKTLSELKRLMELVRQQGDLFAVVLAGHPKLKNLLRHPVMEEIGARATVLTLEGIQGQQREYVTWLLEACMEPGREAVLTSAALERLAEALATPLQVEQYLTLALEEAYRAGQKPVTPDIIDSVLAQGLNDVEPTLARYGYTDRAVADLLHVRPAEVRAFLRGRLPAGDVPPYQPRPLPGGPLIALLDLEASLREKFIIVFNQMMWCTTALKLLFTNDATVSAEASWQDEALTDTVRGLLLTWADPRLCGVLTRR